MPLLKERTLLITIARVEEKLKVNVIPAKMKDGEDQALTTPLSFTGSAEELDAELGRHLASYVDAHIALGSTLAEAKAEMDAAAKVARQKVKTTQQASKPDPAVAKKDESPGPAPPAAEDDAGRSENHLQPPISGTGHGRDHGTRTLWKTIAIQLCESYWDEGVAPTEAGFRSANTN